MKTITWLLLLIPLIASSQQTPYKNLIFEGAGIRGLAYAGAISELEKKGVLDSIKQVGGTSAGAIVALALSLGYSSSEIADIIAKTNFNQFNDGRFGIVGGIHRIKNNFGWYKGQAFEKWIHDLIRSKTKHGDITFLELHQAGFKDIFVTATCLNKQNLIVFSSKSYPHMKVKDAIRISVSIPLYFEAIYIDDQGTIIKNPKNTQNLNLMVDGGIIANFPITLFDSIIVNANGTVQRVPNEATLGIRIDNDSQIKYNSLNGALAPQEINSVASYLSACYIFILENLNRNQLSQSDWNRTISISSKEIGPKVKKLQPAQKQMLMDAGRQGVQDFFRKTE